MKMKHLLFFALIVTVFSCQKEYVISNPETVCKAYPLAIGNSWVYKSTYYNSRRTVDSVKTQTVKLKDTKNYIGNKYFIIDSFYFPLRSKDCNTIGLFDGNTNTEINLINNGATNDSEIYKYTYSGPPENCHYGTRILVNKDRVTINGYSCSKVEFQFTSCSGVFYRKRYYYINEGVGMVKSEAYNMRAGVPVLADVQELQTSKLQQ